MKICLICPSLVTTPPYFGGAIETFTYELGVELAKLNNEVKIITRKGMSDEYNEDSNLTLHFLKIPDNVLIRGIFYNLKTLITLLKLKNMDIIHTQGTSVLPCAVFISKTIKIPLIHTEHVYRPWIDPSDKSLLKRIKYPIELILGKFAMKNVEKIVVSNELMKKSIQMRGLNRKIALEVVPQGINSKAFNFKMKSNYIREKYDLSKGDKIILYVGRIVPEKNLQILLEAFAKIQKTNSNVKLLLVGPRTHKFPTKKGVNVTSSYYRELENWVQQQSLGQSIIFTGPIPYKTISHYYAGSTLLIQPSLFETFGRSIFEAVAMGVPFICTQIGNRKPIYLPKSSGIFINNINAVKLERSIQKMLTSESKFKKDAYNAALHIQQHYNWGEIAKKYLKIYEMVKAYSKN